MLEAGHKLTARGAKQLAEKGVKALKVADEDLYGHYLAEDMVNPETGEIYAEAGDEITEKVLKVLLDAGYDELTMLDIDHVNTGAYIRNTLAVDKNETREDALFDIYRVMRPGEPPTVETAEAMFQSLFFDPRALRPLGGRPRQDEHAPRPRRRGHRPRAPQGGHHRGDRDAGRRSATARARSTTSTISATAASARSAS